MFAPDSRKTIALGSHTPLKFYALRSALDLARMAHADIKSTGVASGVDAQPVGLEMAALGAENRARQAIENIGVLTGIGVESGITLVRGVWIDTATVVIVESGTVRALSVSGGLAFPEACVQECFAAGVASHTVGEFIAKRYGGDPADPHSRLTDGKVDRQTLIRDAIYAAIIPLITAAQAGRRPPG